MNWPYIGLPESAAAVSAEDLDALNAERERVLRDAAELRAAAKAKADEGISQPEAAEAWAWIAPAIALLCVAAVALIARN